MKKIFSIILTFGLVASMLSGCGGTTDVKTVNEARKDALSYDDAIKELSTFYGSIHPTTLEPQLDLNMDNSSVASSLADIDTFDITVRGTGSVNIEIAAATEFSSEAPDDWMNVIAQRFNREQFKVDGQTASVSVRRMASGEVLSYMVDGNYRPDMFVPSNNAWGEMLVASGIQTITLSERIAGNTAGILMKKAAYDNYTSKYGNDVTVDGVLNAAIAGDMVFAYTNPYTSSTGLNILSSMLYAFDNANPLSDTAVSKLVEYQKKAPTAAYTTGVLKKSAAKGLIDAMVMEEQAYVNTPELNDYVFVPAGIRHDHPVYTFDYVSKEKQEVARMFVDYCLSEESQKLATDKGFNRHEDYDGQFNGMNGQRYLAAQKVWKENKNGGRPVIAVFVADVSGSMSGTRISALKQSLLNTMQYIGKDNYIGLVSYDSDVYINLPIKQFDDMQRSYFSGAVKGLTTGSNTATYDATLVGLQMLVDAQKDIPDSQLMLFVLSDGAQNEGYTLSRITPIVGGLSVPVYTIGYEMDSSDKRDLSSLSEINEAVCIDADVDGIVNDLRNLFNVNM